MKYDVKISDDGSFVWQLPQEDMTMELANEMSLEAIKLARENNINKFLSDVRGVKNVSEVFDNYRFAYQDVKKVGYQRSDKIAVLHDADDHSHDFIETVSLNAGYIVKLFTDMKEAVKWLNL